ncbi:hypothetical protein [Sphingomonas parapaucimobilis]|uniref:hypothetical protein n=1 Tax=Sphingomonas parapaucimobilis TaxID=28213 RepID=UPI00321A742A
METGTIQALAAITDEGQFERLATAVLRLVPDYEGLTHTGINVDGKTRRSPVDGLRFLGENGAHLVVVHHTITTAKALRRKWLLDLSTVKPRQRGGRPSEEPGDVTKALAIIAQERKRAPGLKATLVLTTNQEPDDDLVRDATAMGRDQDVTVDIWARSRIAAKLDMTGAGNLIRRKVLGIDAELLSRPLLAELASLNLDNFDAGDDPALRVSRALDNDLVAKGLGAATFLIAPSGSGKTIACHKLLLSHVSAGGIALVVPHEIVEQASSVEQAVTATLLRLLPSLAPGQSPLGLFSEEDALLLLIEDINRSAQPTRLIEKIIGWSPGSDSKHQPAWKLVCPVWPHLLGGVRSQLNDRVTAMSRQPAPMTVAEATALVRVTAAASHVHLDEGRARAIAETLGSDPLLIALNQDWQAPQAERVIQGFCADALRRVQQHGQFLATELNDALLSLGKAMLAHRVIDPNWRNVAGWGLGSEELRALKAIALHGELLRLDGDTDNQALRFRHDRVRDWVLVSAAFSLAETGILPTETIADPALAEIIGGLIVRSEASPATLREVEIHGPFALFHALRLAPAGADWACSVVEVTARWLRDPANRGSSMATLRWQAMAALEEVDGTFMAKLIEAFPESSAMLHLAALRNGDIEGGVALSMRFNLTSVAYWAMPAIAAARRRFGDCIVVKLAELIDQDDNQTEKRRWALIEIAGVIGDPALGLSLLRLWARDANRDENLRVYLWAMARCATPDTAAVLLDPICAAWAALSDERDEHGSTARSSLAGDLVRMGFELAAPLGALDYFVKRAEQADLAWQIEYMLHGIDHPTALLFEARQSAARFRKDPNWYSVNNHARDHWDPRFGRSGSAMGDAGRTALFVLWSDLSEDNALRRAAFDLWAAPHGPQDLAILRRFANDAVLADPVLRRRLERSDSQVIPQLIEMLEGEHGMRWWHYARYVWSGALFDALDRALAREAARPLPDENAQYEIGSALTRPILKLQPSDAEPLLRRYWDKLGRMKHFVQAALHVATPEMCGRAAQVINASDDPACYFEHFTMHYGLKTRGEAGITREAQIRALEPYLHLLDESALEDLAGACDDKGWYALRRSLIDPFRTETRIESPAWFRRVLDENLKFQSSAFLAYRIDEAVKAGVGWRELAVELRTWLQDQADERGLSLAKEVVLHAGGLSDMDILDLWPGKDRVLLADTKTDLDFALRRRNRGAV